jgi:hypothetical protein
MLDEIVIALDYLFGTVEGLDPGVDYPRYSDFRNRTTLMSTIINDQEIFQLYLQDASITKAHMYVMCGCKKKREERKRKG